MASKKINVAFSADVGNFKKSIAQANQALRQSREEFKASTAGMTSWQKTTDGLRAKITQLSSIQEAYTKKLDAMKGILAETTTAYNKNAEKLEDLKKRKKELAEAGDTESDTYKDVCKQIRTTEQAMASQKASIEKSTQSIKLQETQIRGVENESKRWEESLTHLESSLDEAGDEAEAFGSGVREVSKEAGGGFSEIATGATRYIGEKLVDAFSQGMSAVKDFVTGSIEVGREFKKSMSNVEAISGSTKEEMVQLEAKAREMGATTVFSASEASDAMGYMAMAGWDAQQMIDGLPGILALASAGGEELATTSDIVTDGLTAFGLKAEDAAHFSDVMAITSSSANTNVAMLGESFKYCGSLAGSMGYSIEDVGTVLGLMANSGVKASQAGTALRGALGNLAKPSNTVKKAMDDLGISLTDSNGNMKSLDELMQDIRGSFSNLTENQQAYYATAMFGKNAMAGMLAVVNASDEDYKKLSTSISNCDGAAQRMAETMTDNLAGDSAIAQSAMQELQLQISEKLEPVMRVFTKKGTKGVERLQRVFKKFIRNINVDLLAKKLGNLLDSAIDGVEDFIEALPKIISQLQKLKPIVKIIGTAFIGWKLSQPISQFANLIKTVKSSQNIFTGLASVVGASGGEVSKFGSLMASMGQTVASSGGILKAIPALFSQIVAFIGPIGLAVGAVGAVIGVMTALKDAEDKAWESSHKLSESYQEAVEDYKSLQTEIKDSKEAFAESKEEMKAQEGATDKLVAKIDALQQKEKLSNSEKGIMLGYIEQLKELYPDLQVEVDKETGKIKGNTDAWKKNIETKKQELRRQQNAKRQNELLTEQIKLEDSLSRLEKEKQKLSGKGEKAIKDYQEALKKRDAELKKLQGSNGDYYQTMSKRDQIMREFDEASKEYTKGYGKQYMDILDNIAKTQKSMTDSTIEYNRIQNEILKSGFNGVVSEAKKQGIKVPQSVMDGLKQGTYMYQGNVEDLKSLISYDSLVQKAKDVGVGIPAELSNGVKNGLITASDANVQLQRWLDFNEMMKKAKITGQTVPEALKTQILTGKIKPKQAIDSMVADMKKAEDKAKADAKTAGCEVGTAMASGTSSKKEKVKSSARELVQKEKEGLSGSEKVGTEAGENTGKGVVKGIEKEEDNIFAKIAKIADSMGWLFSKKLKINSPSKVFSKISSSIPEGIAVGIEKKSGMAYKAISDVTDGLQDHFGSINAEIGYSAHGSQASQSVSNSTVYNFTQNNNSPKSLDAITIYRQTNNLLRFQKGR